MVHVALLALAIHFEMPFVGRATIVIDDKDGRRVCNVVQGVTFAEGSHLVEWDGKATDGTMVPPGEYTVRKVVHPGLKYKYLRTMVNGGEKGPWPWGPDHTPFASLAALPDGTGFVAGAAFGESGPDTVIMDWDGHVRGAFQRTPPRVANRDLELIWGAGSNVLYSVRRNDRGEEKAFAYDLKNRTVREVPPTVAPPRSTDRRMPSFVAARTVKPYAGTWRHDVLVNPTSWLAAPGGRLWVTEGRMNPKRLTCWDVASGKLLVEKLGSARYGAPGGGMDSEDSTLWIAEDSLWRLDVDTGKEEILASLSDGSVANRSYRFVHDGGRTFVWGYGRVATLYELRDNRLVRMAAFGTPSGWNYGLPNLGPAPEMHDWFKAAVPAIFPGVRLPRDLRKVRNDNGTLVCWRDADGDEEFDADEFTSFPQGTVAAVSGWGPMPESLSFSVPVSIGGNMHLADFVPPYDAGRAFASARKVVDQMPAGASASTPSGCFSDAFGRSIVYDSEPFMIGYDRNGRLAWYVENGYASVQRAQKMPMPEVGVMQGVLFPLGVAEFSKTSEVAAFINDNGRVFFVTTDGVYLDEMFYDGRVSAREDETYLGGEPFGGTFAYDRRNRRYILQAGFGGMRMYEIEGLGRVVEKRERIRISEDDVAEMRRRAASMADKESKSQDMAAYMSIQRGNLANPSETAVWRGGMGNVSMSAAYDDDVLRLRFHVPDPSPWVNNGLDPYLKFKTGDCVDMRFDSENPSRLLVYPGGVMLARECGEGNAHDYSSPWRTYHVGDVVFPDDIKFSVNCDKSEYTLDVRIPMKYVAGIRDGVFPGDFGVIYGDDAGTRNMSRVYWSDKETGLVSDVPGEAMPNIRGWGRIRLEGYPVVRNWESMEDAGVMGTDRAEFPHGACREASPIKQGNGVVVNMVDYLPDGGLVVVTNERWAVRFDRREGKWVERGTPVCMFGSREPALKHGRLVGRRIAACWNGTIRMVDAETFLPAPGVVYGGNSGWSLSRVKENAEANFVDITQVAPDVFAAITPDGVVYHLQEDPKTQRLREVRRLGPIRPAGSFFMTPDGLISTGGMVFDFDACADAPPVAAHTLRREAAGCVLEDGRTAVFVDRPPDLRIKAFGVNAGPIEDDIRRRPYDIEFRPWGDFNPSLSTRAIVHGRVELACWTATGEGAVFELRRNGRPVGVPRSAAVSKEDLAEMLTTAKDAGWCARINPEKGTLEVSDPFGKVRFTRTGLDRPARVAFINGRIAVRTRDRIVKYKLK